jgi:nucleotide-binding universal stress UspA family protein
MFHKILVAIDRSAMNRTVFNQALDLAKATGATLTILNVLSPTDEGSPTMPVLLGQDFYPGGLSVSAIEIYQELWQDFTHEGLALLRSFAKEATAANVPVEFTQNSGAPGRVICDLARTLNADLIMVGRRGVSGLSELIMGSVSNYVLHHAPCSVLTVHCQTSPTLQKVGGQLTSVA